MLTATDIRQARFETAGRGYKKSEVDDLLDQAADSMEQLQSENADLLRKMEVLADRIQQYREDEDSIRSALLTAQKSADKLLRDATAEKDRVISEATQQATEMVRLSEEKSVAIANETREKVTAVIGEAKEKSAQMLAEAKEKSEQMLAESVKSCREEQQYLAFLKQQEGEFRQLLAEMYKRQFELMKKGPEIVKHLEDNLAAEPVPASVAQQEAEPQEVPPTEEDAPVDQQYVDPDEVLLPVAGVPAAEEDKPDDGDVADTPMEENEEETAPIRDGFEIKHKYGELKMGEGYDVSSDDDDDDDDDPDEV